MSSSDIINAPNKHCEICFQTSPQSHYEFVMESRLMIFLNSPYIVEHDAYNKSVVLSGGESIAYDVRVDENTAITVKDLIIPHIFCSDACVNTFTSPKVLVTDILIQKTPLWDFDNSEMKLSVPVVFKIKEHAHKNHECSYCHRIFPNVSKNFVVMKITNPTLIHGTQGKIEIPNNCSFVMSDTNKERKTGKFWCFDFDTADNDYTKKFCSDECAYNYCLKNNVAVMFPNIILNGFQVMITPFTVEANKGLCNPYPYRAQKVKPL